MESMNIKNMMRRFDFKGRLASIQYWQYIQVGDTWGLTLEGQPFLTNADHRGPEGHTWCLNYRSWCLKYSNDLVRPYSEVDQEWFAGLAAQKGVAYQRTIHDCNQFWGQLVVPVYTNDRTKKFVGVIELATFDLERNYVEDYCQIQFLLKDEKLATKEVTIKVEYKEHIVKFPLLSFGIEYLRENVIKRLKKYGVNQQAFLIAGYKGNYIRSDEDLQACLANDLQACIANSSSLVIRMFIKSVY